MNCRMWGACMRLTREITNIIRIAGENSYNQIEWY